VASHLLTRNNVSPPQILFDGSEEAFKRWRKVGRNDFVLEDGEIITIGSDDFAVLYYVAAAFGDFLLQLEFRLPDPLKDNSGIFVRFRNPELPPEPETLARDKLGNIARNPAWIAAYSGFEVQIDEQARGSKEAQERDGLHKNRTGAIYKIPTGEDGEPTFQDYEPAPPLLAGDWNQYAIRVTGDTYVVHLNRHRTTTFINTDFTRGRAPGADPNSGYIGLQSYRNSNVAFRNMLVYPL
jgi:hypothetical protein